MRQAQLYGHIALFLLNKAKSTHRDVSSKKGVVVDSFAPKYRHIFKNGQWKNFSAK